MFESMLALLCGSPASLSPEDPKQKRYRSPSKLYRDELRLRRHIASTQMGTEVMNGNRDIVSAPSFKVIENLGLNVKEKKGARDIVSTSGDSCGICDHLPPVQLTILEWYTKFSAMMLTSSSTFGSYYRFFITARGDEVPRGGRRELYPLPLLCDFSVDVSWQLHLDSIMQACNLCIVALNFLWGDCISSPKLISGARYTAQTLAHARVTSAVLRMVSRLTCHEAMKREAFDSGRYPTLVAADVDMGVQACTCDALGMVKPDLLSTISRTDGIFPSTRLPRSAVPKHSGRDRGEYAALAARGLRSEKLRLRRQVIAGGCGKFGMDNMCRHLHSLHLNRYMC